MSDQKNQAPDALDSAHDAYHRAVADCSALLDRAKLAGSTAIAPTEVVGAIRICTDCARHYHAALWEAVCALVDKGQMEGQRLLGELRLFELTHHRLIARLDALVMAHQYARGSTPVWSTRLDGTP